MVSSIAVGGALGAACGAVVGKLASKAFARLYSKFFVRFDARRVAHIFRNASGHVNPGSAASQARYARLFERVASDPRNFRQDGVSAGVITQHAWDAGVRAFTWTSRSGRQVWVAVRGGIIQDAGVNPIGAIR